MCMLHCQYDNIIYWRNTMIWQQVLCSERYHCTCELINLIIGECPRTIYKIQ